MVKFHLLIDTPRQTLGMISSVCKTRLPLVFYFMLTICLMEFSSFKAISANTTVVEPFIESFSTKTDSIEKTEYSLTGRILDKENQGIFAANVYLKQHIEIATASDIQGAFQLTIPQEQSNDTLVISFVGFITRYLPLKDLTWEHPLEIFLHEDRLLLNAAVVENNPHISEEFSIEKLDKLDIYLSPVSAGDPLKAITLLPSSTNMSENANPEFRGSHSNASQVVLNGIPISNPVRNTQLSGMGNFSLFNADLIDNITVYAGNPPLTYGNSIAGMAEISTCQEIEKSQTQLSVSMANVGLLRSQRLGEKSFIQLYTNYQFSKPYLYLNNLEGSIQSFRTNDVGMNFHTEWNNFSMNLYSYLIDEEYSGYEYSLRSRVRSFAEKKRFFNVLNLRYHTQKWYFEVSAGNNHSDGALHHGQVYAGIAEKQFLGNLSIKYFLNDNIFFQTGVSTDRLHLDYDIKRPVYYFAAEDSTIIHKIDSGIGCFSPEVFAYTRIQMNDNLVLGMGIRKNIGKQFPSYLSYQANLKYKFLDSHSLLLAGGCYHGYYYPVIQHIEFSLQQGKQLSAEYCYAHENTVVKTAAYKKWEKGVSYFSDIDEVNNTLSTIQGLELSIQQQWSHLKISAAYTYLNAQFRQGDSIHQSKNDTPYFLKGSIGYTNDSHFTISCSGCVRPGQYYTPIVGGIYDPEIEQYRPIYGPYNSKRHSFYQCFNLSLNKVIFVPEGNMIVLYATLNNIFNRHNYNGFVYSYDYSAVIGRLYMQTYSIYMGAQFTF